MPDFVACLHYPGEFCFITNGQKERLFLEAIPATVSIRQPERAFRQVSFSPFAIQRTRQTSLLTESLKLGI